MSSLSHHAKTEKSKMMAVGPEPKRPTKLSNYQAMNPTTEDTPFYRFVPKRLQSQVTAKSGSIEVVRANASDLNLIIEILEEAGAWLRSRGIDSPWQMPGYFSRTEFEKRISHGEVYLIMLDREPAGTFTIMQADEEFWGPMPQDTVYLHKFAVKRAFIGKGIGANALEWLEEYALSLDKTWLRLDCLATNPEIRRYYERAGFVHVRDVPRFRWMASLYEKRLR